MDIRGWFQVDCPILSVPTEDAGFTLAEFHMAALMPGPDFMI